MQKGHAPENRWDYLLGHSQSATVIGLEPHSARQDQITKVIKKETGAKEQLKGHLKQGARVTAWLWVASGRDYFADTEKARHRPTQAGVVLAVEYDRENWQRVAIEIWDERREAKRGSSVLNGGW